MAPTAGKAGVSFFSGCFQKQKRLLSRDRNSSFGQEYYDCLGILRTIDKIIMHVSVPFYQTVIDLWTYLAGEVKLQWGGGEYAIRVMNTQICPEILVIFYIRPMREKGTKLETWQQ
jgi:hypothetical protein